MLTRKKIQPAVATRIATTQLIMNSLRGFGCVDIPYRVGNERRYEASRSGITYKESAPNNDAGIDGNISMIPSLDDCFL
jgi:hypothetical protein